LQPEEEEFSEEESASDTEPLPSTSSVSLGPVFEVFVEGEENQQRESDADAEGWLSYLDGKLFLKVRRVMKPLEYAIISASTMKFEGIQCLELPVLNAAEEEAMKEIDSTSPSDNFADFDQGCRILEVTDEVMCRNLLLPLCRRTPDSDGSTR